MRVPFLLVIAVVAAACGTSPSPPGNIPASPAPVAVPRPGLAVADAQMVETVERLLASAEHPGLKWPDISDVAPLLKPLYNGEPDRLLWFTGTTADAALAGALTAIAGAADRGLEPDDYDAAVLAEQWPAIKSGALTGPDLALFDLMVSVSTTRMLRAVNLGRIDPTTMNWGYEIAAKSFDLAAAFDKARHPGGLDAVLDTLEPPVAHYQRATRALATYRALARAGEPAAVAGLLNGRSKVEVGDTWAALPQLLERLRVFGDLPTDAPVSDTVYSSAIADVVRSFQLRHGLEPDGVVGPNTLKAINVPLVQRVRQIALSMERMRWLPDLSSRPNVFVNVPLFRMWATDPVTGEEPLRLKVVVGQSLNHKTPIFIDSMEYVIFRPYWYPPYGITVRELVPHQRRDPSYFDREQLEIVASSDDNAKTWPPTPDNLAAVVAGRLYLRQRPGPNNSLGLAKFIFPNSDSIYMHGTPAQQLFARARRDFSHGCIRLEDPTAFADWVLRNNADWNRRQIETAMNGARPTRVNLKQPVTVVIFYDTVHVNSEGVIFFANDIYAHDQALDAALVQGYPYAVKAS